jgi:selenium-binding protein 1
MPSVVGFTELPHTGDELHHFGWNACSSALCPTGSHTHGDRRYLVVPGIRSSRLYILDTQPDPASPQVVKVLGPEELGKRASYSRPHTVHCGPGYLYVSCLGGGNGADGPGGVALLDHSSFEVLGQFETAGRGDQYLAYDVWWHINYDVLVTSEWGTPSMIEDGVVPDLLLGRKYGHRLHFWDMNSRRHLQTVDLGVSIRWCWSCGPRTIRPASTASSGWWCPSDLSASIWLWHEQDGQWAADKVISIPAEPAPAEQLPPALQPFGAVPPLISDLALSVDDKHLYVSCWGTGELKQYDVSDPFHPRETGSVRIGGIVGRVPHPARPDQPLAGGPQMVEVSRDSKRVYFTNSLYRAWDEQFYPDGVGAWMTKLDVGEDGGIGFDQRFFLEGDTFRGRRVHQVRLEGGDASSDSYCYS